MRWMKHLTRSHLDEKMSVLLNDCGLEGYGFFWLLCEIVAESIGKDSNNCSLTHPLPHWSRLLYSHHHRVSKYLGKLQVIGLCRTSSDGGKLTVTIPNLLKYRDEYSSRIGSSSGQNPERLPTKIEKQNRDRETDTDKTPLPYPPPEPPAAESQNGNHSTPPYPPPGEEEEAHNEKPARTPRAKRPKLEAAPATPLEQEIAETSERIHSRHPAIRSCGCGEIEKMLRTIVKSLPAEERIRKLHGIDENHASWCESEQWTKDGGEYAKGLANWLAPTLGRYNMRAPPEERQQKKHIPTVTELLQAHYDWDEAQARRHLKAVYGTNGVTH